MPVPLARTLRFSIPLQRFSLFAAVLILLTSSFDIFLVINAGGNYRFCQIIASLLVALAIIKAARARRIPVLGAGAICVWALVQILFVPTTAFWPKSLGYCLWLLLNIGMMFSFVQLFSSNSQSVRALLRWYLYSFSIVAGFGVLQFALPIIGLPGVLVTQWWIPNSLPRVNGFSYEPSYYASYLLIGFVFAGSLRRARSSLLPSTALTSIYYLTALGIILSSSRMGILFLFADVLLSQMKPWRSFIVDLTRLRIVRSRLRALLPSFVSLTVILALAGILMIILEKNPAIVLLFLNGTGISDTAAHSFVQRENALQETVAVFIEHPLIGRSLGGVSSAIADHEGETIHSFEESKEFEGMSIFAEVLAASGSLGLLPFVWFLVVTVWKPLRVARCAPLHDSSVLRGLLRSLVFAWAILQFNQNVLRPYLWVHLAILATVYAAASQSIGSPQVIAVAPRAITHGKRLLDSLPT